MRLQQKIFIIGLPRTATTSVCMAMLNLGYTTAHTVYTNESLARAQAIADTPVFCDYQRLDHAFPDSKFIYLQREADVWLPSIRQLLMRMQHNLMRKDGGFNPIIKRCYNTIFDPLNAANIHDNDFLLRCYEQHAYSVFSYFSQRRQDLLTLNVAKPNSYEQLLKFLNKGQVGGAQGFEKINCGAKVTAWNEVKHPLKIASTRCGKIDPDWV